MDASTLIITALAAGLAGFTQGFAGFGSTLAALPLLGAILPVRTAVPVSCLMALCINLLLTSRLKADIRWRPLVRILACSLPGMVLGAPIVTDGGVLLMAKGQEINDLARFRLTEFVKSHGVREPILVHIPLKTQATDQTSAGASPPAPA